MEVGRSRERGGNLSPLTPSSLLPCVPGGYYLTSLSASLALLSGLGQAHALPLSPSQELQRSLSLWEQRRLPATHSFQVTGPPRHPPKLSPRRERRPTQNNAKTASLESVCSTGQLCAQCPGCSALNLHRNRAIVTPFHR